MCSFPFSRRLEEEPVMTFNELSNNLKTQMTQRNNSWLSFQSGLSTGKSPIYLFHNLVEEKHGNDQEAQNPPIAICKMKDKEQLSSRCIQCTMLLQIGNLKIEYVDCYYVLLIEVRKIIH